MGRIVYRLAGLIPAFVIDIINVLLRKLTLVVYCKMKLDT